MLDRRTLFAAMAAGSSLLGAALTGRKAEAKTDIATKNLSPTGDINKRGSKGRFERIPELDLENRYDFFTGFRNFQHRFNAPSKRRVEKILESEGLDPKAKLTMRESLRLIEDDLLVQTSGRTWVSNQQLTWKTLSDYFNDNADEYLAEMEAADNDGPGTLELNPDLNIPKYIQHEIHAMPGGYVGNPFGGHVYHLGQNSFYASISRLGDNEQDQIQTRTVDRLPLPQDKKVRRILDMGCGFGRLTTALKERFPEAEVWGIDVGGPLIRYGHMRARDLGIDVNFAQRSAENTKFEDGYFDIVTSVILNHEMPTEANKAVIKEAHRLVRSGGYYYPIDFKTSGTQDHAYNQYRRWYDHRWNCEPWTPEFLTFDFEGEIEKAGFKINQETRAALPGFGARHAMKTV